ncbi:phospholipid-translocating P-type ATPase (flippase) [Novymonas esmeraldas]|uniref:Phospholipid-transporting ATPase n=1 Tax=Novymonas esmeraldas TaxID=1808958 RepID=A0AAW0F7P0_9TRYP
MQHHRDRAGDTQAMRHIRPLDEAVAGRYRTNRVVNSRYTARNFLWKNLYEQFSRPLNLYFLLVAMLQFISVIAPVNPLSTLLPLLFAFTLTAVKEGYDDVKRHRQDSAYNNVQRVVLDAERGAWVPRVNAAVRVGDVLLLRDGDEIPCDVVVLGATGAVHIRTDNLDGEIDLKPKETVRWYTVSPQSPTRQTHTVCGVLSETEPPAAPGVVAAVAGLSLECPPPSAMVDSFEARADWAPESADTAVSTAATPAPIRISLSHHHLLPQSCVLKNVAQVVCVAVYTGDDTKCGMNKREAPVKWARIDKDVSRYSVYIFVCQLLNAAVFGLVGFLANRSVDETVWYLPQPASEAGASALIYPLRFFLLTTVMIPVSFKFVVDVCKYYMASVVEWDATLMTSGGAGPPVGCRVKNSSILEDLGQIDYLLSDKTGTLTQNVMELDAVTVCPGYDLSLSAIPAGETAALEELIRASSSALLAATSTSTASAAAAVRRFAQMLALCNTVEVVSPQTGAAAVAYHAASPDEVALCNGARKLGVSLVYHDERRAVLRLCGSARDDANGTRSGSVGVGDGVGGEGGGEAKEEEEEEETWLVHHTFQFSSEKKSMGVIVEEPNSGRVWFVVKGADDSVAAMTAPAVVSVTCSAGSPAAALNPACAAKLSHYAHRGLRTLLVACKELSHAELATFLRDVEDANCVTEGRQAHLDALRARMESGVSVLGITAIEDKLQVDVQETIGDMLVAGIKVWMLTGDKMETAEQIGLSCGLYRPGDMVIRVGDASSSARDWRAELLTFPMAQLPPPPLLSTTTSRVRSGAGTTTSRSAAQACGKALETRVLRFDASDPAQLSNGPLRDMEVAADDGAGGGGAAFTSGSAAGAARRSAVLVVQGGAVLESILREPALRSRFGDIARRCCSVICARTTPSQKAAVTQFVRDAGFMTLCVGDGGNDVAMLQAAHVGVGIVGKEGQQAARAADFSIAQFSHLRALLFVHGQQAYARTAYVIKYSFYKSMLISFIQLAYNVVGTHASGGTFWNSFSLTMWNGAFTLPQTILYCLDRCAPRVVLERNPYLYKMTRRAADIAPGEFFVSFVARGVLQSIGLLWMATGVYGSEFAFPTTGGAASNDVTFTVAYTALMLSQVYTLWWESHSVTPANLLMLIGMPLLYVYSTSAYSDRAALQYFGVFRTAMDTTGVLAAVGVSVALTVPSLIYSTLAVARRPNPRDVLRRAENRRQRQFLVRREYSRVQSLWVRWCGATPEAPSVLCDTVGASQTRGGGDGSIV